MDPNKWGSYGWRMIHAYSMLDISKTDYHKWLMATSRVLPCRRCRNNFRRHLSSTTCDHSRTPLELSVCLHDNVRKDQHKKIVKGYTIPAPTTQNLFQTEFWSTIYLNTSLGKDFAIKEWLKHTARLLKLAGKHKESSLVRGILKGDYGDILTKTQDSARKQELKLAIQKFQITIGVPTLTRTQELSRLGKSSRPRATRKRRRISKRNSPSGKTRKASSS